MPVSGQELASLDFANLIGGPLNAVIEAQAKSAITTTNFIKEVGFDEDGKIINVDFTYDKTNENGRKQRFTLTVPFLTMLPIPYITVDSAVVEFNAKITSINESSNERQFSTQIEAEAKGRYWFVSASVKTKTAYQSKAKSSEKAERSFDMHVRVEAHNEDLPGGTARLLDILEGQMFENPGNQLVPFTVLGVDPATGVLEIKTDHFSEIAAGQKFKALSSKTNKLEEYTISAPTDATQTDPAKITATPAEATNILDPAVKGKTIDIDP